jgi:hypothetical protein
MSQTQKGATIRAFRRTDTIAKPQPKYDSIDTNNEIYLNMTASDAATIPHGIMSAMFFVFRVLKPLYGPLETMIAGQSTNVSDASVATPDFFTQ